MYKGENYSQGNRLSFCDYWLERAFPTRVRYNKSIAYNGPHTLLHPGIFNACKSETQKAGTIHG